MGRRLRDIIKLYEGNRPLCRWSVSKTGLPTIYQNLGFNIEDIRRIHQATPDRKIRVLDLGCKEGTSIMQLAREYPEMEAHGLSLKRAPEWRGQENVLWHVAHAHNTRRPDNYFDFVYSHFGIAHATPKSTAFAELYRILRPGGEAKFNMLIQIGGQKEINTWHSELKAAGFEIITENTKPIPGTYPTRVFHVRKPARSE
ncbi:MAG: class I SAM-dependent methyltransferase [Candidatus Diapherotrites archaeon]|nr:class I SAM-dependent methyltransferase [Candidatus Diapherotrites archaeon]